MVNPSVSKLGAAQGGVMRHEAPLHHVEVYMPQSGLCGAARAHRSGGNRDALIILVGEHVP
jgi:hypothetical protein